MIYLQFSLSLFILILIAASISKLLTLEINKSVFISICIMSIIVLILYKIKIYNSFPILLFFSLTLLFIKKIRIIIIKNYLFLIEFIIISLLFFFLLKEKIFMDQDELSYWGIKYKYFISLTTSEIDKLYDFSKYFGNYHPSITSLFHAFNSYIIGFDEGVAIFSNTLILISGFYYLFFFTNQNIIFRLTYLIIFYLILNSLSWGFLAIYTDTVIGVTFAILIINLLHYLEGGKKINLISFIFILIFFLNIHRSAILLSSTLILFIFMEKNLQNKKLKLLFMSFIILIFFYFIYGLLFKSIKLQLNLSEIYKYIKEFFQIILLSKIYNSQFGVLFNELRHFFDFNFILLPEYILSVFIWYLFVIYIYLIANFKNKNINYTLFFIFLVFSLAIYYDKIILNKTSPQTFGRYISFILISFILIFFYKYKYNSKHKDIAKLFFIIFLLLLIAPKKTIGLFTNKNFYQNYDVTNKNYFKIRNDLKNFSNKIKKENTGNKNSAIIIYGSEHGVTAYHYSLFHSALQLELFPINSEFVPIQLFLKKERNINHYISDKNIVIYYNIKSNDIKKLLLSLQIYKINRVYFFNNE